MRTLFTAFILVLLVNAFALGGLVGYLGYTGRLNKDRVQQAAAIFQTTLEEQQALDAQAQKAEQEAVALAEKAFRLEQVAGGPVTPEARLESIQDVNDQQQAVLERQKQEAEALKQLLATQMKVVEDRVAELKKNRETFEKAVESQLEQMEDEDFREAVALLEGLPPKQSKAVLQALLKEGSQDQVVSYLSAMQERKAAAVLTEFKQPNEVAQAAVLIEQLRQRTDKLKKEIDL